MQHSSFWVHFESSTNPAEQWKGLLELHIPCWIHGKYDESRLPPAECSVKDCKCSTHPSECNVKYHKCTTDPAECSGKDYKFRTFPAETMQSTRFSIFSAECSVKDCKWSKRHADRGANSCKYSTRRLTINATHPAETWIKYPAKCSTHPTISRVNDKNVMQHSPCWMQCVVL
jgi:hypothetical protein